MERRQIHRELRKLRTHVRQTIACNSRRFNHCAHVGRKLKKSGAGTSYRLRDLVRPPLYVIKSRAEDNPGFRIQFLKVRRCLQYLPAESHQSGDRERHTELGLQGSSDTADAPLQDVEVLATGICGFLKP